MYSISIQCISLFAVPSLFLSVKFVCGDTSVEKRLWHATHNKIFCAVSSFLLLCTKRIDSLFFILTSSFSSMRASQHAQTNSVCDKLSETKTLLSYIIFSVWERERERNEILCPFSLSQFFLCFWDTSFSFYSVRLSFSLQQSLALARSLFSKKSTSCYRIVSIIIK